MTESELNDFDRIPERPQFLKILCILTFIGSGYLICSGLYSYFNAERNARLIVEVKINDTSNLKKDSRKRNRPPVFVQNILKEVQKSMTPDNIKKDSLGKLLSGLCCIIGALLMWNLKRNGYYLYIFGVILGIATPFYLFGNNSYVILTSIFTGFVGVLFIIFYGMNIRSMK